MRVGFTKEHDSGQAMLHVQVERNARLHAWRMGDLKQGTRQAEGTTPSMLAPPSGGRTVALRGSPNCIARGSLEVLSIYMTAAAVQEQISRTLMRASSFALDPDDLATMLRRTALDRLSGIRGDSKT
jgi:hypothetical protein